MTVITVTRAAYLAACAELVEQRCREGNVFHPADVQYAAETVFGVGAELLPKLGVKLEDS